MMFPERYLTEAVAAQMAVRTRRHPMFGNQRLPGIQIALRDGSQRVMTYGSESECRKAAYQFVAAAMRLQGKVGA